MSNDPTSREWSRALKEILEQQCGWQAQADMLIEPQRRLQEQLKGLLAPQQQWLSEVAKLTESTREAFQQVNRLFEPQREWQRQLNDLWEPHRRIQQQLQSLQLPHVEWQDQLRKLVEPQLRLQETIERTLEPLRRQAVQLQQLLNSQLFSGMPEARRQWEMLSSEYLSNLIPDSIKVDPSGVITLGSEIVTADELSSHLELLAKDLASAASAFEYLHRLLSFLGQLSRPLAQAVLLILLPYVVGIVANMSTPLYEKWWKELTQGPQQEIVESVRETALDRYDSSQLKDYRFVIAKRLRVRANRSKEAEILYELPLGKVIRVLRTDTRWTFVEYFDDEQEDLQQGWVFSRYLARFTK
jgi:hypothetical protein